jgi:hypothetical protein
MSIQEVVKNLEGAVSNLTHLKIVTEVDGKELLTDIDLVQGDIRMKVHSTFLEADKKWLLDLHAAREKQGAEIVKQNVAALGRLAKLLPELKKLL